MIQLLLGGAALASATYGGVQAFAPRSQLYGETFIGTPGQGRKLALTFDDGPNPRCTPELLDLLARHKVSATFFLIGKWVRRHREVVRRIVDEGHGVGNHTFSHPNLIFSSQKRLEREIRECEHAMADAGVAHRDPLFRPPWGARLPHTLRTIRKLGFTPVSWSVTCYDWWRTTPERIAWHASRQIQGGEVLLLHDGDFARENADRTATIRAVDTIIGRYREQGYEFVTIGDWIRSADASDENPSPPDRP